MVDNVCTGRQCFGSQAFLSQGQEIQNAILHRFSAESSISIRPGAVAIRRSERSDVGQFRGMVWSPSQEAVHVNELLWYK